MSDTISTNEEIVTPSEYYSENEEEKKINKGGRPLGSKTKKAFKRAIREYTSDAEVKTMVNRAKKIAKNDKQMLKFLLEHIFGKPRQNIGMDGGTEGAPITMAALMKSLESDKIEAKQDEDGIYKI